MVNRGLLTALVLFAGLLFYQNGGASEVGYSGRTAVPQAPKSCSDVDLRNSVVGEVRDQDSVGWCYAFASADLVSYKIGHQVSAIDIAVNYNDSSFVHRLLKKFGWREHDFQGADDDGVKEAVEATRLKGGVCLEYKFRSEDNGFSDLMSALTKLDKLEIRSGQIQSISCASAAWALFPRLRMNEIIGAIRDSTQAELVNTLSNKACKPRIPIPKLSVETVSRTFWKKDTTEVFQTIDQELNRRNILSVIYNADYLYDHRSAGDKPNHASVIVGRRFNFRRRECEYLVRNSWGRGCSQYDPAYSCDQGNIWLPKQILMKAVENVSYIK